MNNKIIIIGGGIIGMMTARMLHQQGEDIILLEKGQLGKESSWAGGGIVSPLYPWRYAEEILLLSQYSQQHYATLCNELEDETGVSPELIKSGLLMPSHDDIDEAKAWANKYASPLEILNGRDSLQQIDHQINPKFDKALWMPDIVQVRNPRILRALKNSLSQRNIEIREQTQAIDFKYDNKKRVTSVISNQGEEIKCSKVIIASGAWSGQFSVLNQTPANIKPVLGQMILFKAEPKQLQRIILHEGRYLIPRRDGRILCGSTLEFTNFKKHTTKAAKQALQQAAGELAPFLKNVLIEHHWCGLRPGSPNGIPYIGEHPEISNLYVNTGHYRYGVVTGLGAVRLLVDTINGEKSFIDIARFGFDIERQATPEFQPE